MGKPPSSIYRFKVSLLGIEPPIWRTIEVPDTYTFWDLHVAIQDAMGWLDYHLHMFVVKLPGTSHPMEIGIPDGATDDPCTAGWTVKIGASFEKAGDVARYEYDFGDSWSHEIELVAIEPSAAGVKYPRCVGGERACPPEDCGGLPGYEHLLEVLADPDDEEYEEMVDWLKGHAKNYFPYRPDAFDPGTARFRNPSRYLKAMMNRGG